MFFIRLRLKTYLIALLALGFSLALAACGNEATATISANPTLPVPTATFLPTIAPTPTRIVSASYNPAIGFSSNSPKVGETVMINGSGYPANAALDVIISVAEAGNALIISSARLKITTLTDAGGNFSVPLKLDKWVDGKPYQHGVLGVLVVTVDKNPAVQVKATLPIQADPTVVTPAPEDQASKTVLSFFEALKKKDLSYANYLGPILKTKLFAGAIKLEELLGTKDIPASASVTTSRSGSKFIAKTVLTLSNEQTKMLNIELEKGSDGYEISKIEPQAADQ